MTLESFNTLSNVKSTLKKDQITVKVIKIETLTLPETETSSFPTLEVKHINEGQSKSWKLSEIDQIIGSKA